MPKPGKFSNQTWNKPHNDHERGENEGNIRRVTFKNNRYGGGIRGNTKKGPQKDWSRSIRSHLEEEDVDMSGFNFDDAKSKRFVNNSGRRRGGRQGSPAPGIRNKSRLIESGSNWYRVYLPYGNKYDKEFVVTTLSGLVEPTPFLPFLWTTNNVTVTFYMEGHKSAEKLREMDRQIECPDGYKLLIRVNPGTPHTITITPELRAKMKTAMEGRYNIAGKALDLSHFHTDPNLLDSYCALIKPEILLAVIEIMSENTPTLEALKLDNNGLKILILLRKINTSLPNLKILHLAENRLEKIRSLDPLKGSQVVELVLDGNPLCQTCREQSVYISEVRKIFPKLMKLDGINLEPPIVFDVEEEIPLPLSQQTFLCDPQIQDTVRQFLVEYFNCFDSDDRLKLLPAYHENALLSLTMQYPQGKKETSWLNWYSTDNRNLLRVQEPSRRIKLLKQGNQTIVEFLKEMPNSKHDLNSFTVDVPWSTGFILMTVTGMFKELRRGPPIRYFCRTMVIVPVSGGFCISNEQLHITLASDEQAKLAFKTPVVTPQTQSPAQAVNPAVAGSPSSIPVIDAGLKQQMVTAMAQQSGMNLMYSTKCLEEANWNYSQAAVMFTQAHELGKIPPEAFAL